MVLPSGPQPHRPGGCPRPRGVRQLGIRAAQGPPQDRETECADVRIAQGPAHNREDGNTNGNCAMRHSARGRLHTLPPPPPLPPPTRSPGEAGGRPPTLFLVGKGPMVSQTSASHCLAPSPKRHACGLQAQGTASASTS